MISETMLGEPSDPREVAGCPVVRRACDATPVIGAVIWQGGADAQ